MKEGQVGCIFAIGLVVIVIPLIGENLSKSGVGGVVLLVAAILTLLYLLTRD